MGGVIRQPAMGQGARPPREGQCPWRHSPQPWKSCLPADIRSARV